MQFLPSMLSEIKETRSLRILSIIPKEILIILACQTIAK